MCVSTTTEGVIAIGRFFPVAPKQKRRPHPLGYLSDIICGYLSVRVTPQTQRPVGKG